MTMLLRFLGLRAVLLFYRRIAVAGRERIPARGPVIVVANHPNGLVDPVVLRIALGRTLAMLAKSTLFGNALGRAGMRAFDAIPVYRSMDAEDTAKNQATFDRCRALLEGGGWLALFPEGTSHSDPELRPLKTGAARIALLAEEAAAFSLGVRILPVGLLYEDKEIFRSRVAAVVGEPIALLPYAARNAADARASVRELADAIDRALGDVVLEAESQELWRGFLAVASWTSPDGGRDVVAREARARLLARAYRELAARESERAEAVVAEVRRFARRLRAVGVIDPFLLEANAMPGRFLRSLLRLLLLAPPALLGALLGWLPYRLVRPLALRLAAGQTDLVSTYKVLLGFTVMLLTYVLETLAATLWIGPPGLAVFLVAPALGLLAVRFSEKVRLRRETLSAWWFRASRGQAAEEISHRRLELCDRIEKELGQGA
jgi:1-acyl-sn-glycerol-3-phosphate acyltransferase